MVHVSRNDHHSGDIPNGYGVETLSRSKSKTLKTVEERYQKKTPVEHILHRPESYIGSVQREQQSVWVWNHSEQRIALQSITFVPGLYKIFDEILVNAADVKARESHEHRSRSCQVMTYIRVDIDQGNGCITIQNDGEGIPIEIHQEYNIYVPELIFGHLLTSDNYDDSELRVTGGRNGYGAKLTNIFSTTFTLECSDASRQRQFKKTWRNNMSQHDPCVVTSYKEKKDFVKVTFTPDLKRFQLDSLDDEFVSLLTKRVYDVAGCYSLKVWLNGRRLSVDNFKSYVDLYFPSAKPPDNDAASGNADSSKSIIKIHEKSSRWEVIISMSDGQFQQVSFVNAIATLKGGTHVNYVTEPLVQAILKKVALKNKGGMDLKSYQIRAHLWIFLNALIVNPTFDSQTKETLTTKPSQFGSTFMLSDRTISSVIKSDIVETILLWTKMKQQIELQKKLKGVAGRSGRDRITGIPKLEDANDAGTKYANECTLILTEGESAKTSCIAGLSVVGRDRYGVFSLRGKLLNVREASFKQQVENQEIQAILKIMGLQVGKKFETPKGLRYGSLMIMTDQDLDGSHIKGLLINMVAHYWPELLKYRTFLKEFVTPIVKVSRNSEQLSFFTLREYEEWKQQHHNGKGWKTRYYKGLGTSSDREFKEYFSQLQQHSLDFVYNDEEDFSAIDMAFNAKRAEDRKQWIQNYQEGDYVDHSQPIISYKDFIHKELVQFSKYDVTRSIPNCIDGLKPVQRKVLYASFKRNLKAEIKVAQFVGYISECTAYHHGEQSLGTTIIGMAQSFVGSNNINLLEPCGQFGSRKEGGKDASAIRYIFTRLASVTRAIFPEADDPLLEYQNDDGLMVEPKYYVPVIPFTLVNGIEGIGTGWSSSVPNYNPRDLIENIRLYLRGESMNPMTPWYKGFKGRIVPKVGGFESIGVITELDQETVHLTELPVKVWTQTYKQFLEDLLTNTQQPNSDTQRATAGRARTASRTSNTTFSIIDYRDNSSHETIDFTIKIAPETLSVLKEEGLEKAFKLRKPFSTTNMTLFDANSKIQRYASELDIVRDFAQLRYQFYELRRSYIIEKIQRECRILKNKVHFIQAIIDGQLIINNRKKDEIVHDLIQQGFDTYASILEESVLLTRLDQKTKSAESDTQEDSTLSGNAAHRGFEYLLGMSLWSLTLEKIKELKAQEAQKRQELTRYKSVTPEELWEDDLQRLEAALDEQDRLEQAERKEDQQFKTLQHGVSRRNVRTSQKKKNQSSSSNLNQNRPDGHDHSSQQDDQETQRRTTVSKRNLISKPRASRALTQLNKNAVQELTTASSSSSGTNPWVQLSSAESLPSLFAVEPQTSEVSKNSTIIPSSQLIHRVQQRKAATDNNTFPNDKSSTTEGRSRTLEELLGISPAPTIHAVSNVDQESSRNSSNEIASKKHRSTRQTSNKNTKKSRVILSESDTDNSSTESEAVVSSGSCSVSFTSFSSDESMDSVQRRVPSKQNVGRGSKSGRQVNTLSPRSSKTTAKEPGVHQTIRATRSRRAGQKKRTLISPSSPSSNDAIDSE